MKYCNMNFAHLRNDNIASIIEAFNVDKNIDIFDNKTFPAIYNGSFIYKVILPSGRFSTLQVEKHNGNPDVSYVHNLNGPALINFYDSGSVCSIGYFVENELHNPFGPACIYYNHKGIKDREEYFIKGMRHNRVGPAIVNYRKSPGNTYYLNNRLVYKPTFFKKISRL